MEPGLTLCHPIRLGRIEHNLLECDPLGSKEVHSRFRRAGSIFVDWLRFYGIKSCDEQWIRFHAMVLVLPKGETSRGRLIQFVDGHPCLLRDTVDCASWHVTVYRLKILLDPG